MDSKHDDPNYQGIKNELATRLAGWQGLAITSADLPQGVIDQPYAFPLTAWGGTTPYTWEIVAGELPEGLSLESASGMISGIPGRVAHRQITIRVTDSGIATYTGAPQTFIREYNLAVLHSNSSVPVGGAVAGFRPTIVTCRNLTTGQVVQPVLSEATAWNCEAAGLVVTRGDRVQLTFGRGQVDDASAYIGGVATGIVPDKVNCRNVTTGEIVRTTLDGAASWSCVAAGLTVSTGDHIIMRVSGIAD